MKLIKQNLVGLTAAATFSAMAALPGTALAGSTAYANFEITNLVFTDGLEINVDGDPNTEAGITDFGDVLEYLGAGANINLSGTQSTSQVLAVRSDGPSAGSDLKFANDIDFTNGLAIDPAQACVGTNCPGENIFTPGPIGSGEYVRGDVEKSGLGLVRDGSLEPINEKAVSETITQGLGTNDQSSTLATTTLLFTLTGFDGQLALVAEELAYEVSASLAAGTGNASTVTATVGFEFAIQEKDCDANGQNCTDIQAIDFETVGVDGITGLYAVQEIFPSAAFDATTSTGGPGPASATTKDFASFVAFQTEQTLQQDFFYDLTFTITTSTQLLTRAVPEPAPLGLLALGLVAAGAASARRRKSQG